MISPAWPKAKRFRMGSTTADRIGPWSTYESPMIRRNLRWKASGGPRGYPGNWTGKRLFGGAAITHLRRCWGSNGNRLRAWKLNLRLMADRIQIPGTVCHYPPGTSNWNKIEHRLFSFISLNWKAEAATVRSPRVDSIFAGRLRLVRPRRSSDAPDAPLLHRGVHGLFDELARGVQRVFPVADQRRTPFRVEAPNQPTDALAFEVLDDRRPVGGLRGSGGARGGACRGLPRRSESAELGRHDGVLRRRETEVLLPFRLPRLRPLVGIGMRHVAHALRANRAEAQRRQIVGPIEARHQRNGLRVVAPDDRDQVLVDLLPCVPGDRPELVVEGGRFVEELEERHRVVAGVVTRHGAPETVSFLQRGIVHRILKDTGGEVADRVPVQVYVHFQAGTPLHRLVEQFEIFRRGSFAPRHWMYGDAHQARTHLLDLDEVLAVPVPLHLELVRVGDGEAAEQDGAALRIDEFVALDRNQRHRFGVGGVGARTGGAVGPGQQIHRP